VSLSRHIAWFPLSLIGIVVYAEDPATTLNFDSIDATHGRVVANGYLEGYGIKLRGVTPGTIVAITNAHAFSEGRGLVASSPPNVLTQFNSNDPVRYTLVFPRKCREVRFTRPGLLAGPTGVTFPEWNAAALDDEGKVIDEQGEPLGSGKKYYSNVPAETFVLAGPGIAAVRFSSINYHFAGFSAVVIDDLVLVWDEAPK
jgi:hypothetical protein